MSPSAKKKRLKEATVPVERYDTVRRYVVSLLEEHKLSAKDISFFARISEKEAYEHLEHIRKTMHGSREQLLVEPARCQKCDFVFRKRERLKKPGKCPICLSNLIHPPLFSIECRD